VASDRRPVASEEKKKLTQRRRVRRENAEKSRAKTQAKREREATGNVVLKLTWRTA
jgi:hypothetical protein